MSLSWTKIAAGRYMATHPETTIDYHARRDPDHSGRWDVYSVAAGTPASEYRTNAETLREAKASAERYAVRDVGTWRDARYKR